MKIGSLLIILLLLFSGTVYAQAERPDQDRSFYWLRYSNNLNFTDRFSVSTEVDHRRSFSPDRHRQMLIRSTFIFSPDNSLKFGAGGTFTRELDIETGLWTIEWRPHQQIEFIHDLGAFQIEHRFRAEERFVREPDGETLNENYAFNFRGRYRLQLVLRILGEEEKPGNVRLLARNELQVSTGNEGQFIDQLRLGGGINYQPFTPWAVEFLYVWQRRQFDPGNYKTWNVLRLNILHYISL